MKLNTPDVVLHQKGVQASTQYQIAQTAKMMKMLADSLYKDKKKAPVRELSTNAWDAHVMAGNTDQVPVIHLPTRRDPEWRIRDFGTGMSPDDLMKMYQTYGASNKSDSDDYNGCMGIGSKSPFAYASSFTTTSFFNGMKYVYVNAKGEDGIPTINLFHSEPTDEPNGLQISFAVKQEDFRDLQNKTQEVLRWFPKRFTIEGGDGMFRWQDRKYSLEGDGWKIRSDTNQSCAIMGYVEYPIEQSHFSSDKSGRDRNNDWYKYYDETPFIRLLNLGLELHFDIGAVEMDISREGLQYNTQTVKTIKLQLQKVLDEIKEKVEKEFKNCDNLWDARVLMHDLEHGKLRGIKQLMELTEIQFKGEDLHADVRVNDADEFSMVSFNKGYRNTPRRCDYVHRIAANTKDKFYVADMERGNYAAVSRLFEDTATNGLGDNATLYLIKPMTGYTAEQARKAFEKMCGMKDGTVKKCSLVPKPPKAKAAKVKRVNVFTLDQTQLHYYRSSGQNWQRCFWKDGTVDFKDGGVYVEVNAWMVKRKKDALTKIPSTKVMDIVTALKALGVTVPEIVGVKTSVVDKYEKSAKWENFFDWAETQLKAHIKNSNVTQHLSDIETLRSFQGDNEKLTNIVEHSNEKIQDSSNPILILIDKVDSLGKIRERWEKKLEKIQTACNVLEVDQPKSQKGTELEKLVEQVENRYEVLDLIDSWDARRERVATKVVRIINLVDSCSKDK